MRLEKIAETVIEYFETKKDIDKAMNLVNRVGGNVFIKPVYTDPNDERSGLNYVGPCRETIKGFLKDPDVKEVVVSTEPIELRRLRKVIIPNRKNENK